MKEVKEHPGGGEAKYTGDGVWGWGIKHDLQNK